MFCFVVLAFLVVFATCESIVSYYDRKAVKMQNLKRKRDAEFMTKCENFKF